MKLVVELKKVVFGKVVIVFLFVLMRFGLMVFFVGYGLILRMLFLDCSIIVMFGGMWFGISVGRLMLRLM